MKIPEVIDDGAGGGGAAEAAAAGRLKGVWGALSIQNGVFVVTDANCDDYWL